MKRLRLEWVCQGMGSYQVTADGREVATGLEAMWVAVNDHRTGRCYTGWAAGGTGWLQREVAAMLRIDDDEALS